jgi:hypothetical protein
MFVRKIVPIVTISVLAGAMLTASTATAAETTSPETRQSAEPKTAFGTRGPTASSDPKAARSQADPAADTAAVQRRFWTLQMNLCNSGRADCYPNHNGTSIDVAVEHIENERPDIVTLNEVCLNDVDGRLFDTFSNTWPADAKWWYFVAHGDGDTDGAEPVLCDNDEWYGIAMMGHLPSEEWQGRVVKAGYYEMQTSDEWRVWGCLYFIGHNYRCTTHLTPDSQFAAMSQCRDLMVERPDQQPSHIQEFWEEQGGARPTVMGGDLNLFYDFTNPYDVQHCVPEGWYRKGDGGRQHVMATDSIEFVSKELLTDLEPLTDHPGLLVRMRKTS